MSQAATSITPKYFDVSEKDHYAMEKLRNLKKMYTPSPVIRQGKTKWRNCRLDTKNPVNPDFQLGWAILAECSQSRGCINGSECSNKNKRNFFILCSENSPNLTCYITLRVHNRKGQSTILPLRSSLLSLVFSVYTLQDTFSVVVYFSISLISVAEDWKTFHSCYKL